jgi:copper chaperone CopZ
VAAITEEQSEAMANEAGTKVRFAVSGMRCEGCVSGIARALQAHDGVLAQEVSLIYGAATVTYDPKTVSPRDLKLVIEDLGFEAMETP